jgi:ribulose bisphosphate carboxylase small subunit
MAENALREQDKVRCAHIEETVRLHQNENKEWKQMSASILKRANEANSGEIHTNRSWSFAAFAIICPKFGLTIKFNRDTESNAYSNL